jgi:hypothetical protein
MNAKEMFEELEWLLSYKSNNETLYYIKKVNEAVYELNFYLEDKTYDVYGFVKGHDITYQLNAQEHLAITQQLKELGWLDG